MLADQPVEAYFARPEDRGPGTPRRLGYHWMTVRKGPAYSPSLSGTAVHIVGQKIKTLLNHPAISGHNWLKRGNNDSRTT